MKKTKKQIVQKAVAFCLAAVMFAALIPAVPTEAASKTKSIYVVTGVQLETSNPNVSSSQIMSASYSYSKKGLLTKAVANNVGGATLKTATYKYTKNKITSGSVKGSIAGSNSTFKLSYNKKGQLAKIVQKSTAYNAARTITTAFSYTKKGNISKAVVTTKARTESNKSTYKFTYKKGRINTITVDSGTYAAYFYDKYGNLIYLNKGNGYDKKTKNLMVQKLPNTAGDNSNKQETYTNQYRYTYKKISVAKSLVSTVEAQQWAIRNNNVNYAIGFSVLN